MKKFLSFILIIVLVVSATCSINVFAASYPSLSSSGYCEFTAASKMTVYVDTKFSAQGTSNPYKKYNAYIAKNDVCYIYKITSSYAQVNYPTSSGRKTGYIKTAALLGAKINPTKSFTANSKVTTLKYKNGATSGYYEPGDKVYDISGINYNVMYTAKSGKRTYKLAYISGNSKSATETKLRFPLKGSIRRSSTIKTNGYYCDYVAAKNTPIYAPADGSVKFIQRYSTKHNKLMSYGNYIEFTSKDGTYFVRCAHLSSFNTNKKNKINASLSYECGVSQYPSFDDYVVDSKVVKRGELLGYSGKTGNASGYHLHLEVKKNNKAQNPVSVFETWN